MKKIFLLCMLAFTAMGFAQDSTAVAAPKVTYYASAGLSMSNSTALAADGTEKGFQRASYPSVEFGICKDNLSLGLVVGRSDLSDLFQDDVFSDYWYEVKTAVSQPIGKANGYLVLGLGNYIDTDKVFIEYGFGASYTPSKWGGYAQATNWDGVWYLTVGPVYNF